MTPTLESALMLAAYHGKAWYLDAAKQSLGHAKVWRKLNNERMRLQSVANAFEYLRTANKIERAIREYNRSIRES